MFSKIYVIRRPSCIGTASVLALALVLHAPASAAPTPECVDAVDGVESTECGSFSLVNTGNESSALGYTSFAFHDYTTAVGSRAIASSGSDDVELSLDYLPSLVLPGSTSLGSYAHAMGGGSVAIGDQAFVGRLTSISGGFFTLGSVFYGTALGSSASVLSSYGTAVGYGATVTANHAIALGTSSGAMADSAIAIGNNTIANSASAIGIGLQSIANGFSAIAVGTNSTTSAAGAIAIGGDSDDDGNGAMATAAGAVALGDNAHASAQGSIAIGADSIADQANTVSVGTVGNERRIVNVAAGVSATDAVNVSQLEAVTGVITTDVTALETTTATHTTQITNLQTGLADTNADVAVLQTDLAAETAARVAADVALDNRVDALEAVTANLDDRFENIEDRADAGTATAVALSGAMFLPGKTFNLTGNVGAYRGAVAGALQVGALISDMVALNAGVAKGFNKHGKTAVRAGFTLGW